MPHGSGAAAGSRAARRRQDVPFDDPGSRPGPGARGDVPVRGKTSGRMPHSMVCECKAGVLEVSQDSMTKTMNTGDMWRCHKGMVETVENKGTQPAVMRVIELVPA